MDDLFKKYMPGAAKEESSNTVIDPLFQKYGLEAPVTAVAPTPVAEDQRIIAPPRSGYSEQESQQQLVEAQKQPVNQPQSSAPAVEASLYPFKIKVGDFDPIEGVKKHAISSYEMGKEGINEVLSNRPLGVGKIALGALGAVVSPITSLIEEGIEKPITKLTGSEETGKRAGFVAGFGLPVKGATNIVKETLPSNQAIRAIVDKIGADNLPTVIARLKENPRISLADISPAVQQMSQKLITTEGGHQNRFTSWVNDRADTAKGAVKEIYNDTMGTPVNVVQKLDYLKQKIKDVGKNEIEPVLAKTGPVDLSGVIKNIDDIIKPGVNSIITAGKPLPSTDVVKELQNFRALLTDDKKTRIDPKQLSIIQSNLRAEAEGMLNSTDGASRRIGGALMDVRNQIVEAIDAAGAVKGEYKVGLSRYRDENQVQNAFEMGRLITSNRLGRLQDHPDFWDQWAKTASTEEIAAAREGARLAIEHKIGAFKNGARQGTAIPESEFNSDKLKAIFKPDEIKQMSRRLRDEREMADTNQKLIHNSQTAMRMKSEAEVDLPKREKLSMGAFIAPVAEIASNIASQAALGFSIPGAAAIPILTLQGGSKLKFKYADLPLAKAKNERMTDLITATGEGRDELIRILESHLPQPKQNLLQRTRNLALPVVPP